MHILTLVNTGYVPDTCYLNSAISMTSNYKPERPELFSRTFGFINSNINFYFFSAKFKSIVCLISVSLRDITNGLECQSLQEPKIYYQYLRMYVIFNDKLPLKPSSIILTAIAYCIFPSKCLNQLPVGL